MVLLDVAQPSWLLERSTRLLVFLATRAFQTCQILFVVLLMNGQDPKLSHDLLSSGENVVASDDGKAKDAPRLLHIERLCFYLTDTSRKDSAASVSCTTDLIDSDRTIGD
jgi:hypothetical protein